MTRFLSLVGILLLVVSSALGDPIPAKRRFCRPDYAITTCQLRPDACFSDDVCSGTDRCCSYGCGRTCQTTTVRQCHRIDQDACPVSKCFSLGGYAQDVDGCDVCACHKCAADQLPVECVVDPCLGAQCPAHPNAKCVSNYCGECRADFFVDGLRIDCGDNQPTTKPPMPGVCRLSNGSDVVDGASWSEGPCTSCSCHEGRVSCAVMDCAPPPCANPVRSERQCCQVCPVTGLKCFANEIVSNESRPFCQPTCKDRSAPRSCATSDEPAQTGCVCKSGYVRERRFGRCIQENTCPDQQSCATILCRSPLRCRVVFGQALCDDYCYRNRCQRGQKCGEEPVHCLIPPCPTVVKCTPASTEPSTPRVWWILLKRWLQSLLSGSKSG